MATIKIKRSSEYTNKMRSIKILVDGKEIGTIADGETEEFTTSEGQHTIQAKIDWCGSPELLISLNPNDTKILEVSCLKYSKQLFGFISAVILLHFVLSFAFNFYYTAVLLFPVFFVLVYFLTFGRKKYLTLKEMDYGV